MKGFPAAGVTFRCHSLSSAMLTSVDCIICHLNSIWYQPSMYCARPVEPICRWDARFWRAKRKHWLEYEVQHNLQQYCYNCWGFAEFAATKMVTKLEMWANAQRDGRPAEYRWRSLFNAAKFGWRPLLECHAVTLPRRETCWNLQGCPKLTKRSQPLVGRSSPYYGDMWRRYCCLTVFSDCRYMP